MEGVHRLNPDTLPRNPAFSQGVAASIPARTVWVGGQDAVDGSGGIVGEGDLGAQTAQVLRNVSAVLAETDADLANIVKWNVYVVQGLDPRPALAAFAEAWGDRGDPPAITVVQVAALADPAFLVEIDAVAVVP